MDFTMNVKALILHGLKKTTESMVHHQNAHLIRQALVIPQMRMTQTMTWTLVVKAVVDMIIWRRQSTRKLKGKFAMNLFQPLTITALLTMKS